MKKEEKKQANRQQPLPESNNSHRSSDEEILNLDELFDIQGGTEQRDEIDNKDKSCGLGCYGGGANILIKDVGDER